MFLSAVISLIIYLLSLRFIHPPRRAWLTCNGLGAVGAVVTPVILSLFSRNGNPAGEAKIFVHGVSPLLNVFAFIINYSCDNPVSCL